MGYLLMTNVYNEADNIEKVVKQVLKFSLLPSLWVWIDDGSTDSTALEIDRASKGYGSKIDIIRVSLPQKEIGSLATIGQAYNYAFDRLKLKEKEFDFMSIMDVDNIIHPEYYNRMEAYFKTFEKIGVMSGYNFENQNVPMGGSKCIRWNIIKKIDKFWDPAPDTFLNIKAKTMGYDVRVYKHPTFGFIKGPVSSRNLTWNGSYYAGALWAYVYGTKPGALQRVIYRIIKRRNGTAFWKGYRENKIWRCDDDDVRKYYRSKFKSAYDRVKCAWISFFSKTYKVISKLFNRHRL
jgi:glycosyltransferase involved in cell wall biosynthesis